MSEWDQRLLCPDGACVGVIGSDGTCKVCGRAAPNWGDERNRGLIASPDDDEADEEDEDDEGDERADGGEGNEDASPVAASGDDNPEWDQRKLCPDDACIGVIGADGACKVCGRRAA